VPLFPSFYFRDQALQPKALPNAPKGRLIVLWSSGCSQCREELKASAAASPHAGFEVLALSVDALDDPSGAYALMDEVAWPFPWGFVDQPMLERIETLQHAIFDRAVPLSVPLALLLDPENRIVALYRGRVNIKTILAESPSLIGADDETRHHLAPPQAGRWFTHPVPSAFVMEDLSRRFEERFPEDALPYLHLAYEQAGQDKKGRLQAELGAKHHRLAQAHAETNRPEQAAAAFEKALIYTQNSAAIYHNYAILLAQYRQFARARSLLERALAIDPNSSASQEALELVLRSISQSPPGQ
jgi:tetratricopeptide (TPR) repeat protein